MAGNRRYPWSVLGIAPTKDESAIKRSYAAKLKSTRPEDDMEAFQALVAARDFALQGCKPSKAAQASNALGIDRKQKKVKELRKAQSTPSRSVKKNERVRPAVKVAGATPLEFGEKIKILGQYLASVSNTDLRQQSFDVVDELNSLSLDDRALFEDDFLLCVANGLPYVLHLQNTSAGIHRQPFLDKSKLIYLLDKQYGWSENDTRASQIVETYPDFPDQLQQLLYPDRQSFEPPVKYELTWWQKILGIIVLSLMAIKILITIMNFFR